MLEYYLTCDDEQACEMTMECVRLSKRDAPQKHLTVAEFREGDFLRASHVLRKSRVRVARGISEVLQDDGEWRYPEWVLQSLWAIYTNDGGTPE